MTDMAGDDPRGGDMDTAQLRRALMVLRDSNLKSYGPGIRLEEASYDRLLDQRAPDGYPIDEDRLMCHLVWMIREMLTWDLDARRDKAMRWLGFIQGAVVTAGWGTINEMKAVNGEAETATCPIHGTTHLAQFLCPICVGEEREAYDNPP